MRSYFNAYNKDEQFKILVRADDVDDAKLITKGYANDAGLEGDWELEEIDIKDIDESYDCDYLVQSPEYESDDVVYIDEIKEMEE